jgi:predicted ATPase/class 3 adenylate cyclase
MAGPPAAAVTTFLFTDIEGSTPLWEQYPEAMRLALAEHDALLRGAIESHGGRVFKTVGDAFCAAFVSPAAALSAALAAQRGLRDRPQRGASDQESPTAEVLELRVRMGLHAGPAEQRDGDYFGSALNRVARVMGAGHGGQILLTVETAGLLDGALAAGTALRDLGQFRLKGLSQLEHLFQVVASDLPADFPRLNTLDIAPNNLPSVLSSFIGRRAEVAEVQRRVAGSRLVTLTGPGGCGKTRLALEAATRLQAGFPDGVWWIELAPLADPALVPQTVAFTLGLREDPNRPLEKVLTDSLRPKKALLILDNCEHLIDACAGLSDTLLTACPRLHILASSREALGITGETAYRVPSLATADPDHPPSPADLGRVEAVRLFVERAAAVRPEFELAEINATAVAQIVRRLDGIPLAIELAAARVKSLSAGQLAQRLDDRFRLLTGGSRTALPRQQTLRATIDWSYDLLSEPERRLFCRLAVFRGGWTLVAAEAVCDGPDLTGFGNLSGLDILDLLAHLVDKSLVMVEERDGETRYSRLETIRQYGCEKLLESGEGDRVRRRHLDYFLDFAERGDRESRGPRSLEWKRRMDAEQNNLRAALEYAFDTEGASDAVVRFSLAVGGFNGLWSAGSWKEADYWFEKALAHSDALPPTALRARLLYYSALFDDRGPWEKQLSRYEESLVIFDGLGDAYCVDRAYLLTWLGFKLCYQPGEKENGTRYLQEALRIFEDSGDNWGLGFALNLYGAMIVELDNLSSILSKYSKGLITFPKV